MKKLFTIVAMGAAVLTANAQKTVQGSRFFDNWSVGLVGGGIVPVTNSDKVKDVRATYGVEINKQITPIFGLGAQVTAANNVTPSKNIIDASNVTLMGRLNLSNIFLGYKGVPRTFEAELAVGAGWGRNYYPSTVREDYNYLTSKYGLNFNFNLGKQKAWTIGVKPSLVLNMTTDKNNNVIQPKFKNKDMAALELMAGVAYHFKNKSNGMHHMTFLKAYDQAEVDGLNAKINELRNQVNEKDGQIAKANAENRNLQLHLNEARNQKPTVTVKTQTVTNNFNSLEQTVTFRQGKSVVDASQLPNVERVATFLKNHKNSTVDIKGYASPEGSAEVNARIAKARAEAVKDILVNKYKIDANRITAEGQGVGNMFSESDWNRVSICTINETK